MGRKRTFNQSDVIRKAAECFRQYGYEGTSIDDLVRATGLQRGSLYQAFESKRGIFVLALKQELTPDTDLGLDLALVALMELTANDREVAAILTPFLATLGPSPSTRLGTHLLDRAGMTTTSGEPDL